MSLQSLFNKTCSVESLTYTAGTNAGRVQTPTVKYASLPCRIQPRAGQKSLRFLRDSMEVTNVIYVGSAGGGLVSSISITVGDRIKFGTRYYEVLEAHNVDELGRFLTIAAREVRP